MSDAATPATISASIPSCMPAPDLERRDNVGRLTSLVWYGGQTRAATTSTRWLVAVDGSACSVCAVAASAHLVAMGQGDGLDLVNVQPWLSKEAAESELARRGWAATAPARQLLQASATPWQLHVLMGEDAAAIVELAESLDSLGICIGSHGWTAAEAVLLGSVACKVLRLARMPGPDRAVNPIPHRHPPALRPFCVRAASAATSSGVPARPAGIFWRIAR